MRRLVALVIAAGALTVSSGLALASGTGPEAEASETEDGTEVQPLLTICIELPIIDLPDLPPLLECPSPTPEPSVPPPSSPPPTPPEPTAPTPPAETPSPAPESPDPDPATTPAEDEPSPT
ncbi:hypothetical protein, partial [Glycomyces dulcitolivorans]|uniref:hypothetical protein n=1 Tax=Glycomyces dulcitolivorans TaxID=2200759 RepID=UPI001E4E6048